MILFSAVVTQDAIKSNPFKKKSQNEETPRVSLLILQLLFYIDAAEFVLTCQKVKETTTKKCVERKQSDTSRLC
jgi:hypothetical protein